MSKTITLKASARYDCGGKQYIALITGRNPKYTFERTFVGRKYGKQGESSEYQTDTPGLYECRNIGNKGQRRYHYVLIERDVGGGLQEATTDREDAMLLARYLDEGFSFEDAVCKVFPPPVLTDEVTEWLSDSTPEPFPLDGIDTTDLLTELRSRGVNI